MTDITMTQKYFEHEAETLQDAQADKKETRVFKEIDFDNVVKARKLLEKLRTEFLQAESHIIELAGRIQLYEDIIEQDTRQAIE